MKSNYNLMCFIGRMQPVHAEHVRIINDAFEQADNVLILVGGAGKARTTRDPFTYEERVKMIAESVIVPDGKRLFARPLRDFPYADDLWVKQVKNVVKGVQFDIANGGGFANNGTSDVKTGLIGADKDSSSYYLKLFPEWDFVDVGIKNQLHATAIREGYLLGNFSKHELVSNEITPAVAKFLFEEFNKTDDYWNLKYEMEYIDSYRKLWDNTPYPVSFQTCDVVLEHRDRILLIKRKDYPGKGKLALPGGHLNIDETILDGCFRELYEETCIDLDRATLEANIMDTGVFDGINRSQIGRVITNAIHIQLPADMDTPHTVAADDAEDAMWVPISDLREDNMHDDHHGIISSFVGWWDVD